MAKEKNSHKNSGRKLAVILLCAACVLLAAAYLFLRARFIFIDGQLIRRDAPSADLSNAGNVSLSSLLRLENPTALDLRGDELTAEEYDQLHAAFPACDIRWSVPVGGELFDNDATDITLTQLSEEDVPRFAYFSSLVRVDATAVENWQALLALREGYPGLELLWRVTLDGKDWDVASTELTLPEGTAAQEMLDKFVCFTSLEKVTVEGGSLTPEEQTALAAAYPEIYWTWNVQLAGKTVASTTKTLDFSGRKDVDLAELISRAPMLSGVESIDLSDCGFTNAELLPVVEAYPNADILWTFTLYGVEIHSTDTEIDFSNIEIDDVAAIEAILPCMKHLEKVVMCDCGISDEDMDALNKRHEDVRFVWMIHFGTYYLRTDATSFIASLFNGSEANYCRLYDKTVEPLKYCTDMVALDLGHMSFTNCEFVRDMKHLRFLVLAECDVEDISPLAGLQKLFFCELFLTPVKDFSPLLECKALRHLNICHCYPEDMSVIESLTWLERLWFMSAALTYQDITDLRAALPNTELQLGVQGTATGGTWRYVDAYYEMRDALGVYYMAGGTEAPK